MHDEWTGKLDTKDYPVASSTQNMRSYTRVDERTLKFTSKKDGKVITTGTATLSADGKSRTVSRTDTDANGKKVSSMAVYNKVQGARPVLAVDGGFLLDCLREGPETNIISIWVKKLLRSIPVLHQNQRRGWSSPLTAYWADDSYQIQGRGVP